MRINQSLLAALCLASLAFSCDREQVSAESASIPSHDTSIYLLDSSWTDQSGAPRNINDFSGKLIVVSMIFTHCKYACPRILEDLKAVEAGIPEDKRNQVQFLLISMDSERDTPEVLADYAAQRKLDTSSWTLLNGDAFAVRGIAAALGVRYKRDINGDFSHSNLISLLDQDGILIHQLEGLGADTTKSIDAILAHLAQ